MKTLHAKYRNPIQVSIQLDLDFSSDWIRASSMVEVAKRRMLANMKSEMHEKIAIMTLEDIDFKY